MRPTPTSVSAPRIAGRMLRCAVLMLSLSIGCRASRGYDHRHVHGGDHLRNDDHDDDDVDDDDPGDDDDDDDEV